MGCDVRPPRATGLLLGEDRGPLGRSFRGLNPPTCAKRASYALSEIALLNTLELSTHTSTRMYHPSLPRTLPSARTIARPTKMPGPPRFPMK